MKKSRSAYTFRCKKSQTEKEKQYSGSFARRLTLRIVFTLLVAMGVTSLLISLIFWTALGRETTARYQEILYSTNQFVRRILSDVYVAAYNSVPDVESHLDSPDRIAAIMERVVRLNPRIRSCGISFVEGYYPSKGRWYAPCAKRLADGSVVTDYIGDSRHDYHRQKWFVEALSESEGYWSQPFYDSTDSITPLVAYLHPIRDSRGQTVAVLGADLSLDWLSDKMEEMDDKINQRAHRMTSRWQSYCFIIDRDGNYIAHPDAKRVLRSNIIEQARQTADTIDDYALRQMMSGKKGFIGNHLDNALVIDGREVYLFYTPVKHVNWTAAIVTPSSSIYLQAYAVILIITVLIVIFLLVVFFGFRRGVRHAVNPLKMLAITAHEVARGHFDTPLPAIKSRDEIRLLRDSFEEMQHSLTQYVKDLTATASQKASMENELKIAHDIQMSMLPKVSSPYPDRTDIDVYGSLTPAKAIGGDLFDFCIRDEKLYFCIGDVSGKGVPASLVMAVTRTLFRNILKHIDEPDTIVKALNNAIAEDNDANMFVTIFVGVLDLASGQLSYCNGGHNAPLLIGSGVHSPLSTVNCLTSSARYDLQVKELSTVSELPCDPNLPIGILPDVPFTLQTVTLEPGTTIFLYTDGLTEAEDVNHAQFGEKRVTDIAESVLADETCQPQVLVDRMVAAVHQFVGEAEQSDDLTLLAISYRS